MHVINRWPLANEPERNELMIYTTTTRAHHTTAAKARRRLSESGNLGRAELALTVCLYQEENDRANVDSVSPAMVEATRVAQLLLCAFSNANYTEAALLNEGPVGKLSRFRHAHGVVYVRDYGERSRSFASSLSRQSEIITKVCSEYLGTSVGVRVRRLTSARGWSYYMTKGWRHSEHVDGEGKDNWLTLNTYAPCLPDEAVVGNLRADAKRNAWHRMPLQALTEELAEALRNLTATKTVNDKCRSTTNKHDLRTDESPSHVRHQNPRTSPKYR